MDMEDFHCGCCGKYVSEEDGFYGSAEIEPMRIYCSRDCCEKAEPD